MPFVDLVHRDDYASLWYTTNTPNGHVSSFDPAKPTIVMLHPLCLDRSWMYPQLEDERLNGENNIILFDTRTTGKSLCRPTGRYDLWVSAADLAFSFYYLNLPPAHIFAPELYGYTALRLAYLFPDMCVSVTLCNIPAQTEVRDVFDAFDNLVRLWSYAEDLTTFEHACKQLSNFFIGSDAHPDLVDDLISFFSIHYPPFRRSYGITNTNISLNRTPMTDSELASIACPVLIIQAESSASYPLPLAEQLAGKMTSAPGGVTVFPVKCSASCLSLLCPSIVNQVFNKFLLRQQLARSDFRYHDATLAEYMAVALRRLARLKDDPSIATRDPTCPLSFCCFSQDVIDSQAETIATYAKGQRQAFSPLDSTGRPIRKYSERNDHWLDIAADGYSYTPSFVAKYYQGKGKNKHNGGSDDVARRRLQERHDPFTLASSEPASEEQLQLGRIRRANLHQETVDRHVIKGSMTKVVSNTAGVSLGPWLLR